MKETQNNTKQLRFPPHPTLQNSAIFMKPQSDTSRGFVPCCSMQTSSPRATATSGSNSNILAVLEAEATAWAAWAKKSFEPLTESKDQKPESTWTLTNANDHQSTSHGTLWNPAKSQKLTSHLKIQSTN